MTSRDMLIKNKNVTIFVFYARTYALAGALAVQMVAIRQQHMLTSDVYIRCVLSGLGKPLAEQHCCFCLGCAASLCVHASMSESKKPSPDSKDA